MNIQYRKSAVFRTFLLHALTYFAYDFILMYYRLSLSVVTLSHFFKELSLFLNLEYRKCAVFRTFLLHALRYCAEILHMTLF